MRPLPALLALAPTLLSASGGAPSLTVGSPAPALTLSRWVKGTPVPAFEKGKVYVVEFWATWCGPCRQTIPHLSEMAKTYAGKATFLGVDVWERGEAAAVDKAVDAFVKDMGERMAYSVARDTADGQMAKIWMAAAGQDGIPAAFIVDREGRVAWVGHPMSGLDKALGAVVAGTHDLAAAKAEHERQQIQSQHRAALIKDYMPAFNQAAKAKDYPKLLETVRKAEAAFPDMDEMIFPNKLTALLHTAPEEAKALLGAEEKKEDPDLLTAAIVIGGEEGLPQALYERGLGYLATELKSPTASPNLRAHLARLLHRLGRNAEAAAEQKKLLEQVRGKASEARLKQYEVDLKLYEQAVKG